MDFNAFLEYANSRPGFNMHNGFKIVAAALGYAEVEVELLPHTLNPMGAAHGGLIFALGDTAAGAAGKTHGFHVVTQSASVSYLRPAVGEKLRAIARQRHHGRRTAVYEVEIQNDDGSVSAIMTFNLFILEKPIVIVLD